MDTIAVRYRTDLTSFRATQVAAEAAYRMAGFGPERVEVAEMHDAFAPFELISLEDTGLVPPGKAGRATLDGETAIGGRLPVNPSGGLKARGHPLAATGISQIVELVWQLRGQAEGRQVDARVALAQSIGGPRHQQLGDARSRRGHDRRTCCGPPAARAAGASSRPPARPCAPIIPCAMEPHLRARPSARSSRSRRCTRRPRASARRCTSRSSSSTAALGSSATARRRAASRSARACRVEDVDSVFYFSHMGFADRARLFWRRTGDRGEKMAAIGKSFVKGFWKGTSRDEAR